VSEWLWRSMNPGAATRPLPSIVAFAAPFHSPTARIVSPLIARSPTIPSRPVPSTIVAPRIRTSASSGGVAWRKRRAASSSRMSMLRRSDLQVFHGLRELREVAAAGLRDEHHVLDADAADAEVVEARLDRHHRAGLEEAVTRAHRRGFVDVEPDAVARAVEEADHLAVARLGLVAQAVEDLLDLLVDRPAVDPVAHGLDADLLGLEDRRVEPLDRRRRLPLHHRAGLVGEVVGVAGAREDVED